MKRWSLLAAILWSVLPLAAAEPARPWLGVGVTPQRDASGKRFLHVQRVVPGGPCDRAGIRPGDLVIAIGGTSLQIGDDLDFLLFVADRKPGERLPFRIVRDGERKDVIVIVAALPESARAAWDRALHVAREKRALAQRARR